MTEIKPIETVYNGYRFRSRLEARWAVFFEKAGIKYEYETEGFENDQGEKYLPDFYLPELDTYVEVKGERVEAWDELKRASHFITWGGVIRRILILSEIPVGCDGGMWHFPCLYWSGKADCVWPGWWFFQGQYDDEGKPDVIGHISGADYIPPWGIWDNDEYLSFKRELSFQAISDSVLRKERNMPVPVDVESQLGFNCAVFDALEAARKARFEHGENGRPQNSIMSKAALRQF